MKSLWDESTAGGCPDDLALRVYTSRLLGQEPSLVLHGGGNTSVKINELNVVGESEDILYIKGSGWDLATIEAAGFAPVRMAHLLKLAQLPTLSDAVMVNELKTQCTRASAPAPSVETILHATLPYKFVDHTHADALLSLTNNPQGAERVQAVYGDDVVVIPYIMPGFDLARVCAARFAAEAHAGTIGMVLMNHGIFSFGNTARESYERMIALVSRAEDYLKAHGAWQIELPEVAHPDKQPSEAQAALRRKLSDVAGRPMLLTADRSPRSMAFLAHHDLASLALQGPATPDHVIRTKRLPLIGRDVAAYVEAYRDYFNAFSAQARTPVTMLDPAPRLILDAELGICALASSAKEAAVINDIYRHTVEIVLRAHALGGYRALPANDIFDMEYWELEQAKLSSGSKSPEFAGEVAIVTGAASGIGRACVCSLLARGAAVVGLDRDSTITRLHNRPDFHGIQCDVTDIESLSSAIAQAVSRFGGIDMVVLNAGIFPGGCPIAELSQASWRQVMDVNLDANLNLMRLLYPYLRLSPRYGRVVVMGSKNVSAPGPGAAAYSASKAALVQLMRVAALEWAKDGIRINAVHPDAVFDTGIWSDEVLQARARHYGMSVEQYKRKNLLGVELTSHDVAELVCTLCGPVFAKTTGAQLPVDGGNDRVI